MNRIKCRLLFYFILFVLLNSCHKQHSKGSQRLSINYPSSEMDFNPTIKQFVDQFIDSTVTCRDCKYEIIVDKKDELQTVVGMRCYSNKALTYPNRKNISPSFLIITYRGVRFDVYDGLEEVINKYPILRNTNNKIDSRDAFYKYWCVVINKEDTGKESVFLNKIGCADFIPLHLKPTEKW